MRQHGGKSRIRKPIARLLQHIANTAGMPRIEDRYCGTLAVSRGLFEAGTLVAAALDMNEPLIRVYEAVRDGWGPPDSLSKEDYYRIKRGRQDPRDPMTGFALCFCSFRGKFGGGYLGDDERSPEGSSGRSAAIKAQQDLLSLRPMLKLIDLRCEDATANFPTLPSVLYFDPEYEGTEGYDATAPHDFARYLRRTEAQKRNHFIVASEFKMPETWREIGAIAVKPHGLKRDKVERFFVPIGGLSDELLRDAPFSLG